MRRALALLAALALAFALGACAEAPVRVASKTHAESRLLAEMFALLLEEAGLPVERRIPLGDDAAVFEALRAGEIDLYPEEVGTGLALLGLPPGIDAAAARERVEAELDRLGLATLPPLGFEAPYVVVVEPGLAEARGLDGAADLAASAGSLRLAVSEGFATRPLIGLQGLLDRYGLRFGSVEIVPEDRRRAVYDHLIDNRADVAIGLATDAEIAAYGLRTLDPGAEFSVSFEAIPLASAAALSRHPEIREALGRLSGRLDAETMRRLSGAVSLDGRAPRDVAREALVDLGLAEPAAESAAGPHRIAVLRPDLGTRMANETLRAARLSVSGRGVALVGAEDPAAAILERRARVALAPSVALFAFDGRGATPRGDLEAIAAVGTYLLHAFAAPDGPGALGEAARIAAGPPGSPSHAMALAVAGRSDPPREVIALESGDAGEIAEAVAAGAADAGVLLAPAGRPDVAAALKGGAVRLVPAADWWAGAARLAYPFLSLATIPAEGPTGAPVPTVAMQAVVIGPAPPAIGLGRQGPSTYSDEPGPVSDRVVRAFNEHLGPHSEVGYALPRAAALTRRPEGGGRALNPAPGHTILSIGIVLFLIWAGWLLTRPDEMRRGE